MPGWDQVHAVSGVMTSTILSDTSQQSEWRSRARGMMLPTDFTPHIGCTIEKEETNDFRSKP